MSLDLQFTISDKKKKDLFISIFQVLKNCASQLNLILNKNTFHIQGMDKSHVCLFDLSLSLEWFDSYQVNNLHKLCVDSNIFYSMISTKSDDQSLNIKLISDDTLSIELVNNGTKNSDYNKYFILQLLDFDYDTMVIPDKEYDVEFTLPSKKITDIISQLCNFGDTININCSIDCVDFKTNGDSGEMRVNIPADDLISYAVVENEQISLNYSLLYISKMCISNKLSTDIEFSLSNDCPMKIKYDLGNDSILTFYIAPKLSDD